MVERLVKSAGWEGMWGRRHRATVCVPRRRRRLRGHRAGGAFRSVEWLASSCGSITGGTPVPRWRAPRLVDGEEVGEIVGGGLVEEVWVFAEGADLFALRGGEAGFEVAVEFLEQEG